MARPQERRLVETLSDWFARSARDLPWRRRRHGKRSAYAALVSELMLQQTQVARVLERYAAFMRRFPSVRDLASADEQDVLEIWQGMGYYRRARHLHQAAQAIVERHTGRVPADAATLRHLPGIGRYTAGAIASIVFDKPEPIVDGNVERVLARIYGQRHANGDARPWSWETADRLVRLAPLPGTFNEAMMELGATVCTPKAPKCDTCPVAKQCAARRAGEPARFPGPRERAKQQASVHHAVVVTRPGDSTILLEQRPAEGMWAGMWQVPTVESAKALSAGQLCAMLSVSVSGLRDVGAFAHATTHRAITFHVFTARARHRCGTWVARDSEALERLPMSAAQRRVLSMT